MSVKEGMQIGNVRLLRMLGEGGMGSVWIADHLTLDTQVAVKFITESLVDNEQALARFAQEARSAAKIKSPHVVQVLDHGVTDDGIPFITMELLEGEALDERLAKGPLSVAETTMLVKQVSRGLKMAHNKGIVHRDLKPANLFLVDAGYDIFAKILDFGIAKNSNAGDLGPATATSAVAGTAYYMSPEQLRSTKNVDQRADVWAMAVLVYECLTGSRPFDGESVADLAIAVCTEPHPDIRSLDPALPAWLETFFNVAFHKNLNRRHHDIEDFAEHFSTQSRPPDTVIDGHAGLPTPNALTQPSIPTLDSEPLVLKRAATNPTGPGAEVSDADISGQRTVLSDGPPVSMDMAPSPITLGTAPAVSSALSTEPPQQTSGKKKWLIAAGALFVLGGVIYAVAGLGTTDTAPAAAASGSASGAETEGVPDATPTTTLTVEPAPSADAPPEPTAAPSASIAPVAVPAPAHPASPRPRPNPVPTAQPPKPLPPPPPPPAPRPPSPKPACKEQLVRVNGKLVVKCL